MSNWRNDHRFETPVVREILSEHSNLDRDTFIDGLGGLPPETTDPEAVDDTGYPPNVIDFAKWLAKKTLPDNLIEVDFRHGKRT